MKMRPPATPIINVDPYFSVWAEESVLKNTVHWTGSPNTMAGRVFVDEEEYHFLGLNPKKSLPEMQIETTEIDAYSTTIIYKNEAIRFKVQFTSPTLVTDLYYSSRPVAFAKTSFESIDGKDHSVSVKFIATEEFVLNKKGEGRALADTLGLPNLTAIRMGNAEQNPLWRSGDDLRIDWGYFYLAAKGKATACHTVFDGMYAVSVETALQNDALFLFAYDDIDSIKYFGENLKAYWKKGGKTIQDALTEAAADYETILARCTEFSAKLKAEATLKGGEKYAELLLLSMRQVMAAHKLVVDKDGNNLYISKECFSNGCAATVDVTYPSAPLFLLYNPELLKAMLRPIMNYAYSDAWPFDFAPHDVGQYPLVNGNVYGLEKNDQGVEELKRDLQMPVEECGNMIVLFAAIAEAENDPSFAKEHIETIKRWSEYLIKYGLDPENQLCTNDFAGHLAHNVNLSIKAIMGVAGYARILFMLGDKKEAEKMMKKAKEYADSVINRAKNSDGSYRLAFDKPETFSLKYNAVWDKLWGTNLFPEEFYKGEIERYKKELLPYGVPLDSREKYTKSDWTVWAATLCDKKEDFCLFADRLWQAYNTMHTLVPMTDWYFANTSNMVAFRHRSVQGGLYIKLML